mgnify:CR=1 FL=1
MSLRYAPRYRESYSEAARASRLVGAVKTVKQLLCLVRVNIFAAVWRAYNNTRLSFSRLSVMGEPGEAYFTALSIKTDTNRRTAYSSPI